MQSELIEDFEGFSTTIETDRICCIWCKELLHGHNFLLDLIHLTNLEIVPWVNFTQHFHEFMHNCKIYNASQNMINAWIERVNIHPIKEKRKLVK